MEVIMYNFVKKSFEMKEVENFELNSFEENLRGKV